MTRTISLLLLLIASVGYSQSIRFMTYNIRLDHVSDGVNQWPQRKTKVFDLIRKYDPAIFGVQEALPNQMEDLAKNLPDYSYLGVGRDDGKAKGEFSAIFFKKDQFEVEDQNTFWLSETPDVPGSKSWDAAITRIATWGKFRDKKTKKKFLVINTHFDHKGTEARKKSAELLKTKAMEIAGQLPVIISGDFNCTRDEAPYPLIMSASQPVLSDPAPSPAPGTFCGFKVNSMECRGIDYIFYSSHWKAKGYQAITDNDGQYYPSDHLPVVVNLKLK